MVSVKRSVIIFLLLFVVVIAGNINKPVLLPERFIVPEEYDKSEIQRYRDKIQLVVKNFRIDINRLKGLVGSDVVFDMGTINATLDELRAGIDSLDARCDTLEGYFGSMTPTSGHLLIADGIEFETMPMSGNGTIDANGVLDITYSDSTGTIGREVVQDLIGGMVNGNTETGITVTYDDPSDEFDFVVYVNDAQVANDITCSNYLLLAGGIVATLYLGAEHADSLAMTKKWIQSQIDTLNNRIDTTNNTADSIITNCCP